MALNWIDGLIILLSLAVVMAVGWSAGSGESKTTGSYFLASEQLPWYAIGASWVATSVSSEQIVGTVGMAYKVGMGVANWEWFSWPVYTLMLTVFIPVYMKGRITTVPDFLTRRFGPFCSRFYTYIMLVAYIFIFLPTVFYSGTVAFADLTGISFWIVLGSVVLLVGTYTVRGGLAAVVWADVAQCVMLLGGGLVLFFVALSHIPGGWSAMQHANPGRFHLILSAGDPDAPFPGLLAASVGVFLFYNASNQVMVQRVLGARTTWDGLMGMVFSALINLARPLVTCFLGFIVFYYCVQHGQMLSSPNLTFSFAVRTFGTTGLRGVIMAGFLAAVMGASSALVNSAATIFTLDIYGRSINPAAPESRKIFVGRLASVAVLLMAAAWCPIIGISQTIFTYFQTGVTYLATPFIAVVLMGVLWRRPGARAGAVGLVGGLAIQILVALGAKLLFTFGYLPRPLHWLYAAFIAEVLTILLIIGVSLATAPASAEQIAGLVWQPSLVFSQQTRQPQWYKSIWLWYAVYSCAWFFLYYHFR